MQKLELKRQLQNAFLVRKNLNLSSHCLFAGKADGIADLIIHNYENHLFLQTRNPKLDVMIPEICKILEKRFQPQAIWLKNHCDVRLKYNGELKDQLLLGTAESQIAIQENNHVYVYNTHSKKLFPLEKRSLRLLANELAHKQNSKDQILTLSSDFDFLLPGDLQNQITALPCLAPHWSEACEKLRNLKNPFAKIIVELGPVFKTEKNQKGVFHVLYNLLQKTTDPAEMVFSQTRTPWLLPLLKKAATKQKKSLKIEEISTPTPDFPTNPSKKSLTIPRTYKITVKLMASDEKSEQPNDPRTDNKSVSSMRAD